MSVNKHKNFTALNISKGIVIWFAVILHSKTFFDDSIRAFDAVYNWLSTVINPFFFAASGFGLMFAYRNKIADIGFFSFIWKRLKKLYPMYFITTVIMLLFTIKAEGLDSIVLKDVLQNFLLMTTGWFRNIIPYNIPTWFFSVLLLMYIIFWAVEKLFRKNDINVYLVLTCVGILLMIINLDIPFLYHENGLGIAGFSIGALVYGFYSKYCIGKKGILINVMAALIMTFLSVLVIKLFPSKIVLSYKEPIFSLLVIPAILLWSISEPLNKLTDGVRILDRTLGRITKNVFLWHLIIVRVFNALCLRFNVYKMVGMKNSYILYLITTFIVCLVITDFEGKVWKKA